MAMAEEIRTDRESRPEPLSVLWRILAAPQTLLVLAGLLALVLAVVSLVPQIPSQAMDDPQAWLATQPGPLGRRGSIVSILGLYDLYHAFLFRALLALVALVLFVRLVDAAELAWRALGRSADPGAAWVAGEGYAPRAQILSSLPLEDLQQRIYRFLDRRGYRYIELDGAPPARWLASRRPALLWLRPLAYAALLLAAAGLTISAYWGWQDEAWRPLPGDTRLVAHDTSYALRLDRFEMESDRQGRLRDYTSHVTWLSGGTVAHEDVVSTRHPVHFDGLALRQIGYLPTVRLWAWDGAGSPLELESGREGRPGTAQVEIRFQEVDEQPLVLIPSQERLLALVFEPMCAEGPPALHVDLLGERGDWRQRLASVTASSQVSGPDLRLRIELSYGPVLRLDRRPGMGLVVAGASLAVLALLVGWILPPRPISFVAEPGNTGQVRVRITSPPGVGVRQWLQQLAAQLEEALADED